MGYVREAYGKSVLSAVDSFTKKEGALTKFTTINSGQRNGVLPFLKSKLYTQIDRVPLMTGHKPRMKEGERIEADLQPH